MLQKRILLIDDNQSLLEAYKNILINEGYQVDTAESGEQGLEILKEYDHKIVITDVRFPSDQMDGFRIIEEAKRVSSDCEVIVITGYSDLDLAIKAMHCDASDFVPKPCRKKDLMMAIKRASEKLEMRRLVREYTDTLKGMVDKKNQELARIEEKLIHTAKLTAMGEMASSICHELRQPLCGIMGFTYLAAEAVPENSKAREYLKKVEEQISRMEQIVNNMRIFSRKSDESLSPLSINEVVHSATSLFSHQFKNYSIDLIEELDDTIPPVTGNKSKLQQVVVNLLSNARDAINEISDGRKKMVNIRTSYDHENRKVGICITDNGIGIDEEINDKIFQSFFTTKKEDLGTGLGLSVSKSIVSDYDGEIKVISKKGQGSSFIVSLPIDKNSKKTKETLDDPDRFVMENGQWDVASI